MKRKASEFDDCDSTPPRWFLSSSPQVIPATGMITPPPESTSQSNTTHAYQNNPWPVRSIPSFNLRTRKRYRDGRPDEETIHQNTLAKLFGAQRQEMLDRQQSPPSPTPNFQISLDQTQSAYEMQLQVMQPPEIRVDPPARPVERNQRSIESFFGARPVHVTEVPPSNAEPPANEASQRILFAPETFAFSSSLDCRPRCEDCSTLLLGTERLQDSNNNNMDVSMGDDMETSAVFACAICNRIVCDTCAVRGDHRVCLECAMPGNGNTNDRVLDWVQQQQSAMMLS